MNSKISNTNISQTSSSVSTSKNNNSKIERLLWLDMEMTGLDPKKEKIIEVAAIVTGWNLKPIEEYSTVVRQDPEVLTRMDDWNQKHHRESGLLAQIPSGKDPGVAESELIQLISRHFPAGPHVVLAGNSIFQDRVFITEHWPRMAALLHYRMLDVTSWKIVFQAYKDIKFNKQNSHRAIDDIRESIAEFQHYLQHSQLLPPV